MGRGKCLACLLRAYPNHGISIGKKTKTSGTGFVSEVQMITEVGAEQNTMTIVMMPSEFVSMARGIGEIAAKAVQKP
jgi:hypothetical protein